MKEKQFSHNEHNRINLTSRFLGLELSILSEYKILPNSYSTFTDLLFKTITEFHSIEMRRLIAIMVCVVFSLFGMLLNSSICIVLFLSTESVLRLAWYFFAHMETSSLLLYRAVKLIMLLYRALGLRSHPKYPPPSPRVRQTRSTTKEY